MNNKISEKDSKKIIELHKAFQTSHYTEHYDEFELISLNINPSHNWFKGSSSKDGLDTQKFPPAKMEDLIELETKLKTKLPPLYEAYLLGSRCVCMEFEDFKIFPNVPGKGLTTIYKQMIQDKNMGLPLIEKGYIPIGKRSDYNYDPICFNKNFEIVTFDHEEILMDEKFNPIKIFNNMEELFDNFIEQCKNNLK